MPTRTVLVVGSPGLPLAALTATLRLTPHLNVVGPATDAAALSQCIPPDRLDLVLAEWEPRGDLLRSVREATRCRQFFPAIVLVGEGMELYELVAMRTLGIAGYLSWSDLDPATVRSAIRAALHGYFVLGPHVAGLSLRLLLPQSSSCPPAPFLTQRQRDVLRGLSAGMSEQQLAVSGGVSARTVRRAVMELKSKFAAQSLSAVAAQAGRLGLTADVNEMP